MVMIEKLLKLGVKNEVPNIKKLPKNDKKDIDIMGFFFADMQAMLHTLVMMTSCRNLQNLTILS